ncbi:unnamed protein product [Hymenolepis diminuta]|uniref:Uncharacterized protein n=1 Tax=Hymenolepis diminuta TaxID=6216 RepID=A0A564YAZ8_HYMDI|nr:unnamed protein product [Hymenolepis diminuta]
MQEHAAHGKIRYCRVCPYQNRSCNVCGKKGHRVESYQSDTKGQKKKKSNTGKASTAFDSLNFWVLPVFVEVDYGGGPTCPPPTDLNFRNHAATPCGVNFSCSLATQLIITSINLSVNSSVKCGECEVVSFDFNLHERSTNSSTFHFVGRNFYFDLYEKEKNHC